MEEIQTGDCETDSFCCCPGRPLTTVYKRAWGQSWTRNTDQQARVQKVWLAAGGEQEGGVEWRRSLVAMQMSRQLIKQGLQETE